MEGSDEAILALDDARVMGFVTAITDGVLSAYIPLLEVLPGHRGRGIGSELVRRMLARLEGMYMVDLLSDPGLQPFHLVLGMRSATGMMVRRYTNGPGTNPDGAIY